MALEIIPVLCRNAKPGRRLHRMVEISTRILSRQTFTLLLLSLKAFNLLTFITMTRILMTMVYTTHYNHIRLVHKWLLIFQVWIWFFPNVTFWNKLMVISWVCAIYLHSWRVRSKTPSHRSVAVWQIAHAYWVLRLIHVHSFFYVTSLGITSNLPHNSWIIAWLIHIILTTSITLAIALILHDWHVIHHREVLGTLEFCTSIMFPVVSVRFWAVKEYILAPVLWICCMLCWRTHLFLRKILFKMLNLK